VLAGCAAQVPSTILAQTCSTTNCHTSTKAEELLDLQSPGVVARLLNVPAIEEPQLMLIDPKTPGRSYILYKVQLAQPPSGMQMPASWSSLGIEQAAPPLSAAQLSCFQQWVFAEAAGPY
jgi:hypothetical protein